MRATTAFLITAIGFLCFVNGASAAPYTVREGDTLSTIARTHFHGKLYGSDGVLTKLLDLNNVEITNPDLIFPGQIVHFEENDGGRSVASVTGDEPVQESDQDPAPAPSALPAPSGTPVPEKTEAPQDSSPFSLLSITPSFRYSEFSAVDKMSGGSAHVLSDLYPQVDFGWQQVWTKDTETHLGFGFSYYTTEPLQARDLNPHSSSLSEFGFGFRSSVSDRFKLGLDLESMQALIVRGVSFSTLTDDRIQANKLMAAIRYNITSIGHFSLSTEVRGGLIAPAQFSGYSMTTGSSWSAAINIDQEVSAGVLHGGLFWNQSTYNTSITTQTDSAVGIEFGFGWSVGK